MRYLIAVFATFVFVACCTTPIHCSQSQAASPIQAPASQAQKASPDPPVQFLLEAAATDFHAHHPPYPARFRHVRIGHIMTSDGTKQYMLCGEFLPAQEGGKSDWTPFATIKTSGYEQWAGSQAATFCHQSKIVWDKQGDLSSSLQDRFDSLR